jgi:hypothetical protein
MQRFWEFIIYYLYEIPRKKRHEKEIYFRDDDSGYIRCARFAIMRR